MEKSMPDTILAVIGKAFPLKPKETGEFSALKVSGMNFRVRCFEAEGLGHVSAMSARGFFGLMKMDTLIINPFDKDMPLCSYDWISAMGRETLCLELYHTMVDGTDLSALDAIAREYAKLPDYDTGPHWYDPIKLPQSQFKRGKKVHRAAFHALAQAYLKTYVQLCTTAAGCDRAEKVQKATAYSEGLLEHGGPAANVFIKNLGREKTAEMFRKVLFGTYE